MYENKVSKNSTNSKNLTRPWSEKNLNYVKKDELEKTKQKLAQKVCRDIKNKYLGILSDKGINIEFFSDKFLREI